MQPAERARFAEVDLLKAVGILVVVLIHSLRPEWDPGASGLERWLGHATRFAVPGFFFASGYLYASQRPVAPAVTRSRLRRMLLPYLVFSLAGQAWLLWQGAPPPSGSRLLDLLLGSTFGPYYYVFVATLFVLATPLLARLTQRTLLVMLGLGALAQIVFDTAIRLHFYWHLRNPLLWIAFFLAGWLVRRHAPPLRQAIARARGGWAASVGAVLAGALGLAGAGLGPFPTRIATWVGTWAAIALLFVLGSGRDTRALPAPWGRLLRSLSDATYTIYLAHLFFLEPVRTWLPQPFGGFSPLALLAPWLAGLAGSLALVWLGRAALGARSRTWIGA